MLFLGAEAHHVFHPGAVVPAPVKDYDLPGCRETLYIALNVHLGLLSIRRGRQSYQPENAGADALRDGAYRPAFTSSIAPLEDDDHSEPFILDPILKLAELLLEPAKFLLIFLALQRFI